jgi:hypothetical protein
LVNQIADAEKRQTKAQTALDGLDSSSPEYVTAQAALAAAETTTADLRK